MPQGSSRNDIGLFPEGRFLVLRRDDGGRWRLDTNPSTEKLLAERVRVESLRRGFDLLGERRIASC